MNRLEYRYLKERGISIFIDVLPGFTRTFSPRQRSKNCETGIACGDTCISKNKVCKKTIPTGAKAELEKVVSKQVSSVDRRDFASLIAFGRESLSSVFDEEAMTSRIKELQSLKEKYEVLEAETFAAKGEKFRELNEKRRDLKDEIWRQEKLINNDFESVLEFLRKDSNKSEIQSVIDSMQFLGFDPKREEELKGQIAEFLSLSGASSLSGLVATTFTVQQTKGRAFAVFSKIAIADSDPKSTVFHELGHHLEFNDRDLLTSNREWVKSRATGSVSKLSEMTGNSNYDESERAYPDLFVDPYVGKVYGSGYSTEVISMGVQHLTTGSDSHELFRADPEHFYLTIGTILSVPKR